MVCIGMHGHNSRRLRDNLLLGSTATKLLHVSSVPVLALRRARRISFSVSVPRHALTRAPWSYSNSTKTRPFADQFTGQEN